MQRRRHNGSGFDPAVELSAEAGDVLTTPLLPGLEIRVGEIFEQRPVPPLTGGPRKSPS